MKYLKLFDLDADYQVFIEGEEFVTPNLSGTKDARIVYYNPNPIPIDYSTQYLTFTSLEDGMTVSFNKHSTSGTLNYSIDEGKTWTELTNITPSINNGKKIMFKGDLTPYSTNGIGTYSATKNFDVSGNAMSLLYGDDFVGQTDLTGKNYAFGDLFDGCTTVVNAKDLSLPATTLANYCYRSMFEDCTSLTSVPELPATTLANYCYYRMFKGCTSLTTAPELAATTLVDNCYYGMFSGCTSLTTTHELPATTLAGGCYQGMFWSCTSLTTAPELPATTLAKSCYQGMFGSCTSLTSVPELPATTLTEACYSQMFQNCTSLTTAPDLPATTLETQCYAQMFSGCTSLNYIKMLATNISAMFCLTNWVTNVSSTGTFVKSAGMNIPSGTSGIPSGWTVQEV